MRELKFRAFNNLSQKMYWFDVMWGNIHALGQGYIGQNRKYNNFKDNRIGVDPYDCKIMQFTGLKDKNGQEIYEGDIIRSPLENIGEILFGNKTYKTNTDEYECNGWLFRRADKHTETLDSSIIAGVIIGNIYENPELLK